MMPAYAASNSSGSTGKSDPPVALNRFNSLTSDYERAYYTGILRERTAKAQLRAGRPPHTVAPTFEDAMRCFEAAEKISPPDNDDAILRWNRCVRLLQSRSGAEWKKEMEEFDASEGPPV